MQNRLLTGGFMYAIIRWNSLIPAYDWSYFACANDSVILNSKEYLPCIVSLSEKTTPDSGWINF